MNFVDSLKTKTKAPALFLSDGSSIGAKIITSVGLPEFRLPLKSIQDPQIISWHDVDIHSV